MARSRAKRKSGRGAASAAPPAGPRPGSRLRLALPPGLAAWRDRVPFLRRRPAVSRAEVLAAVPFRNELIAWELRPPDPEGGEAVPVAVLQIPRRRDRVGRILNRLFEAPGHKQVILDELGTDVWCLCDGETSVDTLIRALARKHKLERREVEVSLTTYLRTLARRGFIGLRVGPAGGRTE